MRYGNRTLCPPAALTWADEDSRGDCIIRFSRPVISADGTQALVDVRVEDSPCRCPHGHIYTLRKRNGTWRVVGEGGDGTVDPPLHQKQSDE
jgi:hypothetical protein